MDFLYALEGIRTPALDAVMSAITQLGGEVVYMAVAIIAFWCVNKNLGYYILTTGFAGTVFNQFLKITCRVDRPWVRDPDFTIVESARAEATGYSFPSGHTQNAFATFGCLGMWSRKTLWRALCLLVIILIAFSRMYLGVHTPADVGVSFVAGLVLTLALWPLFRDIDKHPRRMYGVLGSMLGLTLAYLCYVELFPFPDGTDAENLASALENGYKLFGACVAMLTAYIVDHRHIHFDTHAPLAGQILKCVLGLALVMAIRSGLKSPLYALFGEGGVADAVRYFLTVIFAAAIWPMTFRWIARVGGGRRSK